MAHDPRQIYNVANSFFIASDRCFEKRPTGDKTFEMPLVPAVVCAVFSIELGLKSILALEKKKVMGHELKKLFIKLSPNSRKELSVLLSITEDELRKRLISISKVFVEWRYIYEKESAQLDEGFLRAFAKAVNELAANKAVHATSA